MKQDKYTMDPARKIYLGNNKKMIGQKWFLNKKIKKNFWKKMLGNFFSTSSNYT